MNMSNAADTDVDVIIVGAGFGGLYALQAARRAGLRAAVFEAGSDVGGTWYWNRYPGARCDVESLEYQYGFSDTIQREWDWTERYSGQNEIQRYISHVADTLDLRADIRFNCRVLAARFDERTSRWTVETDTQGVFTTQFCIMATGCLSTAQLPNIEGRDSFSGQSYHTGDWPRERVDFTGKRVGVIGTGSSGIQVIPQIAQQAAELFVFQRTPNFSLPAENRALEPELAAASKANFEELRAQVQYTPGGTLYELSDQSALDVSPEERERVYEDRWLNGGFAFMTAFADLLTNREANETAAEFVRKKIRGKVNDPTTAELLCPSDHPFGTKRLCLDTNYFETYNLPHVHLVDIRSAPIERITPVGILSGGKEYTLDAIVFATGFDAMTGSLLRIDICGRDGLSLREKWAAGPQTYLGLMSVGFPNMFFVTGPGSPSVFANMVVAIEQHVDWIMECVASLRKQGTDTIEPKIEDEVRWGATVNAIAAQTLYPEANSWYMGANIPGKPRTFMLYAGGFGAYRRICDDVAANAYEGFSVS